ncbi:MAG TPA: hypothetical protein VFP68_01095, partial [Burkholderiaceae bacterium]|nr:hypothetical protein [Burkholderiaceae bacterium]
GAGCGSCGPTQMRYAYNAIGQLVRATRLDDQGRAVASQLIQYDGFGRLVKLGRRDEANPKAAVQWVRRYEYRDMTMSDGRIGLAPKPHVIAQPSVIPGKEHTLRIDYNQAWQPTRVTEQGFSPLADDGTPTVQGTAIARAVTYRYTEVNGRSVLSEIDGPLPNGPTNSPADADITRVQRDENSRHITAVTYPMNQRVTLERDDGGRVVRRIGVDSVVETLGYDVQGRVIELRRAGLTLRLRYDSAGRLTTAQDALGQELRLEHDAGGRLVALRDQQGNRIVWDYQGETAQQMRLLNPDGTLDQRRLLQTASEPTYEPSPVDSPRALDWPSPLPDQVDVRLVRLPPIATEVQAVLTVADEQGRITTDRYDDFGQLVARDSPVTGRTAFRYDLSGALVERIAADKGAVRIVRDAAGRPIRVMADGEDARIEWGRANKPVRIRYREGEERFEYDAQARLVAHVQVVDGRQWSVRYSYDDAGRLVRKTTPGGQELGYRYNGSQHPKPGLLSGIYLDGILDAPIVT